MKSEKSRGFTLIELLIVVVVITTLLGLMFRLAGVGEDQAKRNRTIARMQKLEFALSGYYAAFGSYPPVPLHGSRDIFCDVNDHGIQKSSGGTSSAKLEWVRSVAAQAKAAGIPVLVDQLEIEGTCVGDSACFPADLRLTEYPWKNDGIRWSTPAGGGISYAREGDAWLIAGPA